MKKNKEDDTLKVRHDHAKDHGSYPPPLKKKCLAHPRMFLKGGGRS